MSDSGNALDFLTSQQVISLSGGQLAIGTDSNLNSGGISTVPPWIQPPVGFSSFDQQGVVAMPAAPNGVATILTFTVPSGYDGVIKRLSHNATGGGFVQGSGDLSWMITLDGRPVKNYSNMLTELGTTQIPRFTDGIQIYSNQVVSYIITHIANVALAGSSIATLAGYYYPRQSGG